MIPDSCISVLINTFHPEVVGQDKVQDARKDTDTHHFGSHGRAYAERYRDFADRDPPFPVNTF